MANPMTIGELKAALARKDEAAEVRFDFAYFFPADCHSYRGFYDRPAIGYTNIGDPPTVKEVLALLHELTHLEFKGYKGGDYTYCDEQVLYVAQPNESGGTVIMDVFNDDLYVRLKTTVIE